MKLLILNHIESSIKNRKMDSFKLWKNCRNFIKRNNKKILDIIEKVSDCLYNNEYIKKEFRNITEKLLFKYYKKSMKYYYKKMIIFIYYI